MSDHELPEWLSEARALVRHRGPFDVRDDWPILPRVGELRVADPTVAGQADPRMVMVIGIQPEIGVAEVALASNETEFAGRQDVVADAAATGLPFDLLLEVEMVERIWCVQLGLIVAELDSVLTGTVRRRVMELRTEAARTEPIAEWESGLDQRRLFKRRERADLEALAEDCRQALGRHRGGSAVVLDPALFDPVSSGDEVPAFDRWLAIAQKVVASAAVEVPVGVLESALEGYRMGTFGPDTVRALWPLFERVLVERTPRLDGEFELVPARRRPGDPEDGELMSMLSAASRRGCRTVRVLTVPEAWTGVFPEPMVMARFVAAQGTELQIIRHDLEAGR